MVAAVLTIDINARLASLEQGLANAVRGVGGSAKRIESQLSGLNSQVKAFGLTALAAFGVPVGIGEFVSVLGAIKDKTAEGERSLNALDAVLKATGNSAGLTAKDLAEIGKGVEAKSIFDDDAIRAAETALLRFRSVQGQVFRDAINLAPDLASALGVDLPAAAQALGRALTDPEHGMKALKAAGVVLSDQEKDLAARLIEAGDKAGAQKIVLDALTKSVGGASEADNTGLYGASKRLSRSWDDLQKAFGRKIFGDSGQNADFLTKQVDNLTDRVEKSRLKWLDFVKVLALPVNPGAVAGLIVGDALTGPSARVGVSGKISGVTPEMQDAEDAKRVANLKEREEQAYNDQQAALKKRADGAATFYGAAFAQLKAHLDAKQSALDFSYQQNEISSAAYYAKERELAEANLQAQGKFIRQQQEAQEAVLHAPSSNRDERLAAEQKLIALTGQNLAAISDRDKRLEQINRKQQIDVERLIDDYAALNVQLLEVTGNTVAAANAAFILAHKDSRKKIAAELTSEDPEARSRAAAAAADLDRLQSLVTLQARLTDATKTYSLTLDEVNIAERNIAAQLESGAIGELDSLRLISEARAGKIGKLREELTVLQAIAAESGKREDIIHVQELQARLAELAATGDLVAKKFNEIGASSLSDALQGLANGTKTFKQAAQDFGKSITEKINKVFADQLSEKLFSKDGPLGGFGDFFSKLLGGKGGEAATGATGAAALTTSATALTTSGTLLTTSGTALATAAGALTSAAAALAASAGASTGSAAFGLAGKAFSSGSGSGGFEFDAGFGAGEGFAIGTPYVPRDMITKIHKGERIVTADRNRAGAQRMATARPVNVVIHQNFHGTPNTQSFRQAGNAARDAIFSRAKDR